ncbi:Uncharacterized protein TCM_042025 [Theobroma cacao]|uniref:Uncharacterized protein n=1 Tax=Theobroma cacao TaxID=3641 RepID=A0A061H077_THECC|nr:Uncharacterized protein TCM_042025 [Theobroma cacao]
MVRLRGPQVPAECLKTSIFFSFLVVGHNFASAQQEPGSPALRYKYSRTFVKKYQSTPWDFNNSREKRKEKK